MKDPCIRKLLKDTQLGHFYNDPESRVIEEMNLPVAKARIDIAVLNGSLHGYEIKSASDTLKRLPGQLEAYAKVFDYLSIVTEDKYCEEIKELAPSWVGIITCYENNGITSIKHIRKPKLNKQQHGFYLAKLLWREELITVLNDRQISFRKKDRNWLLCEALALGVDVKTLSSIVRETLKMRDDWKTDADSKEYFQLR